jgi:hypothetical protein
MTIQWPSPELAPVDFRIVADVISASQATITGIPGLQPGGPPQNVFTLTRVIPPPTHHPDGMRQPGPMWPKGDFRRFAVSSAADDAPIPGRRWNNQEQITEQRAPWSQETA